MKNLRHPLSILLSILAPAAIAGTAVAQTDPAAPVVYRLGSSSVLNFSCLDDPRCVCPARPEFPMTGTFVLTPRGVQDGFADYRVTEVNWFDGFITGSGEYRIGGDPLMQVMDLDLGHRGRFSSGLVPVTVPFPAIDIAILEQPQSCVIDVLEVRAAPVPLDEIKPYALLDGSTFRRGSLGGRRCPREQELPIRGNFALVPLSNDPLSLFTEFAVVSARWAIVVPTLGEVPVEGAGIYLHGGSSGTQQQLRLKLTVAGKDVPHFDSGLVEGGSNFPRIDALVVSDLPRRCGDYLIDVHAAPTGAP